ncbi:MAG TPA: hypothetical protein VNA15_06870 [Candidatus Angelobacter sp.]|nr:hypothetical protein [Candidatus Angelobacter sp.]
MLLPMISNLYKAPDAIQQTPATLALVWQTTQAIFTQLDTAAGNFPTTGYVLLGIAMLRPASRPLPPRPPTGPTSIFTTPLLLARDWA